MVFLHTSNEISEREAKKTIPFTAATTTKIRYLGINLIHEAEDLYLENYRILKKEIKKTQINGSIYCDHGIRRINTTRCPYYPKQYIDLMQILSKYQWSST